MVAPVAVPIDQRFAQLIQQFGLTKNAFAMSLGKTASVVQHLIDGRNKPGYDLLCRIFEIYPNVSRDWLLLGRGPMLIGGELPPKTPAPIVATVPELPLEPIDLTDVEVPAPRRAASAGAGARLQPAEIAATLALAAAAAQPVRAAVSLSSEIPAGPEVPPAAGPPAPASVVDFPASVSNGLAAPPAAPGQPASAGPLVLPAQAPAPALPGGPAGLSPEAYVGAALHAQHMQHQLALAELRNQHLLEQQQMLREMLAMARQAMV